MKLDVSGDPAGRAAAEIARAIRASEGPFQLALSGGGTARSLFSSLAARDVEWGRVHLWQVDERLAPPGHPDRNWTAVTEELDVGASFHPMPVDEPDADLRYAAILPRLDLVHLGLGEDGHTASLFAGDAWPAADVGFVGEHGGWRRLTLGFGPIRRARRVLWLVCGAHKREALRRMTIGEPGVASVEVGREDALVFCDRDAGG